MGQLDSSKDLQHLIASYGIGPWSASPARQLWCSPLYMMAAIKNGTFGASSFPQRQGLYLVLTAAGKPLIDGVDIIIDDG